MFLRLKKQYCATNERIGKTGAGLKPKDIMPGSEIANIIGILTSYTIWCFSYANLTVCIEKETENFKW